MLKEYPVLARLLSEQTDLWIERIQEFARRFQDDRQAIVGSILEGIDPGVVIEFMAIGLLAGLLASTGASLAAWHLAVNVYELEYHFSPVLWLSGPLLGIIFVGLSGLIATWRVVTHSPVSVLRAV